MNNEKLREELRDLIIRDFGMTYKLSNQEVRNLLFSIPEFAFKGKALEYLTEAQVASDKFKHLETILKDIDSHLSEKEENIAASLLDMTTHYVNMLTEHVSHLIQHAIDELKGNQEA